MDLPRVALLFALAGCATSGSGATALVEIETLVPLAQSLDRSAIHRVTVRQDGSIVRHSHLYTADTRRTERDQTLTDDQLRAIAEVLAAPVRAEQQSIPFEASQFRITAHGSPGWSVECWELDVYSCPIPFVKLWQSLDEIIGDLPER